jgi:hypothetical protein
MPGTVPTFLRELLPLSSTNPTEQKLTNFFSVMGQIGNTVGFSGHKVSVKITQF